MSYKCYNSACLQVRFRLDLRALTKSFSVFTTKKVLLSPTKEASTDILGSVIMLLTLSMYFQWRDAYNEGKKVTECLGIHWILR